MSTSNNSINNTVGAATTTNFLSHLRSASGQWDNFNDQTDVHGYYSGVGSPEGVVAADIGSTYSDTGAGATGIYYKTTDTVNTGWALIPATATGAAFSAFLGATANNVTGNSATYTLISFTEEFDQGNNFNAATGVFTAPSDGVYALGCSVYSGGNTIATQFTSAIVTPLQTYLNRFSRAASALDYSMPCNCVTFLNAGDTVTFTGFVAGEAGNTSDILGSAVSPRLTYVYGQQISSSVLSGSFSVVAQTFIANGTYTPTAGMQYCQVEMVGGGGGGGGAAGPAAAQIALGGSGGAGEYARGVFSAATIGVSQAVTIGAAGAGGAAGNNAGTAGGTTSLGALITAVGGGAGGGGASTLQPMTIGALGGTGGAGGDFRSPGQAGGLAFAILAQGGNTVAGFGGSSQFGAGARCTSSSGQTGLGKGSGGGGGVGVIVATPQAGGAGSAGLILITEYVIV